MGKVKLQVCLVDGHAYEYEVEDELKAKDHMDSIIQNGYMRVDNAVAVWYAPHLIEKIIATPFQLGRHSKDVMIK